MDTLKRHIESLATAYSEKLASRIAKRQLEMASDDTSHYLVYRVLGISDDEGRLIDEYQNTGRFLYKYAGAFLEDAATACLKHAYPNGQKVKIDNTFGGRPKKFEVDFLNGNDAIEIKWRDATTDGDHTTKEHTRIQAIRAKGYKPIRVMFYYPQRQQAVRIQQTLATLYKGISGEYYAGDDAWAFVKKYTGVDLKEMLVEIASRRSHGNGSG
ncbi:MAG: ApaLI family restriction endonuclease [Thermoguttaceae bacterium]